MPKKCLVTTCQNYFPESYKHSKFKDTEIPSKIKMYYIPTDTVERNIWKLRAGKASEYKVKNKDRICQEHFPVEVRHSLQCQLMNTNNARCMCRIPKGQRPCLNLPSKSKDTCDRELERAKRLKLRENRKMVHQLLLQDDSTSNCDNQLNAWSKGSQESLPVQNSIEDATYPVEKNDRTTADDAQDTTPEQFVIMYETLPVEQELEETMKSQEDSYVIMDSTLPVEEDFQVFSESDSEDQPCAAHVVKTEPSVFHLEDLCRVCGLNGGDMVDIFGTEGTESELQSKINLCLPIKVVEGDSLPLHLCRKCMARLEESHAFACTCLHADRTLRTLLQGHQELFQQNGIPETEDELTNSLRTEIPDNNQEEEEACFDNGPDDLIDKPELCNQAKTCLIPNNNETYFCGYCTRTYLSEADLAAHEDQGHRFLCAYCDFSVVGTDPKCLEDHYNIRHTQTNVFTMPKKDDFVKDTPPLLNDTIEEMPKFKCKICFENLSNRRNLKIHYLRLHSLILCCDLNCLDYFEKEVKLRIHCLEIHKKNYENYKIELFTCEQCGRKFKAKNCLKDHIFYDHDKNKNKFPCHLCAKTFRRSIYLKYHLKVHAGQKDFECIYCDKMFFSPMALRNHKIMRCERKHECPKCNRTFKTMNCLKMHTKKVHYGNPWSYDCNVCKTKFTYKSDLLVHYHSHTPEEKSSTLGIWSKTSRFQCKTCLTYLHSRHSLDNHTKRQQCIHYPIKNSTTQLFECNTCLKKFTTKEYLEIHIVGKHMPIKPYLCSFCKKDFATKLEKKSHERIHSNNFTDARLRSFALTLKFQAKTV